MSKILDNIYIWVFLVKSESVLLLAFVKYTLYNHCTKSCIFFTFWRLRTLVLWRKIVKIFLYLCICLVQKTAQLILEKLNSATAGRRKLPDLSLNRKNMFNVNGKYRGKRKLVKDTRINTSSILSSSDFCYVYIWFWFSFFIFFVKSWNYNTSRNNM